MTGIIEFDTVKVVIDEERRDKLIQHYMAAHDGNNYRIKVDRTLRPPYYELFLDYKQNGRPTSLRLFATSELEKIGRCYFSPTGGGSKSLGDGRQNPISPLGKREK